MFADAGRTVAVGQSEEAFFKDRMRAIPEGEREARHLLIVTDPSKTVFSPSDRHANATDHD